LPSTEVSRCDTSSPTWRFTALSDSAIASTLIVSRALRWRRAIDRNYVVVPSIDA